MDQIIGEREAKRDAIDKVKKEYHIDIQHEDQDSHIVFTIQNDGTADAQDSGGLTRLAITSHTAAMRRNPRTAGTKSHPCMADIERVKTGMISAAAIIEGYRQKEFMKKLLSGALAYQNQMQVPLCFVKNVAECPDSDMSETADAVSIENIIENFIESNGFHYIYDRPHYELNTEMISVDMLERAATGETVCLGTSNITLQVVGQENLLSLAHFVNSRLCRQYGFFIIRSAAYYEGVLEKLQSSGGNLFQIMEDGIRKGCFAYTDISTDCISEVVFDKESDRDRYLVTGEKKKPAVMARIVNLPEMLKHIAGNGKITIAIRIKDPMIAENDGLFIWFIDTEGSHIERVEQLNTADEKDSSMRPEVTVTIGEFTAILFDYMQLKQNAKFGSIYLAGPAWMNEI